MSLPALYRGLTAAASPLVFLFLKYRQWRGKEDKTRFGERFGRPGRERPSAPLVWVHAASIGEVNSVRTLIERLLDERPSLEVLVTAGTVTAAHLLESRLPLRTRHQFVPVDLPGAVQRFLDYWRPELAILVESELWPNLVLMTRQRGIPLLLLNGRMSAASFARWRLGRGIAQPMLGSFRLCLAQDEIQADRLRTLGAGNADFVGDLKIAGKPLPVDASALARLRQEAGNRPLWLAASTHRGEEEIALAVHRRVAGEHPGLLTVIAPRHINRVDEIAALAKSRGLSVARRSWGEAITPETDCYLADTYGELGVFYSLAGVAFVGGSLAANGGHNMIEAAHFDCAVLSGPDTSNCAAMADALTRASAAEIVADADALADAVLRLLDDPKLRRDRARRAAKVAADGLAILDAVLDRLAPWLDPMAPQRTLPDAPAASADARA